VMFEEWKSIESFEGIYEVSNLGRVRRIDPRWASNVDGLMGTNILPNGYVQVHLRRPGKKRVNAYVHRLVAKAFVPNPNGLPEVNHQNEDGDKTRNRWDNLEWTTRSGNNIHKNRVLKTHHNKRLYLLTSPEGIKFTADNLVQFADEHSLGNSSGLAMVAIGTRNHHHGWTCSYADLRKED
jgi:hypothetical protein